MRETESVHYGGTGFFPDAAERQPVHFLDGC
jgi:hypothetical protein